jgi:hypothetical protein
VKLGAAIEKLAASKQQPAKLQEKSIEDSPEKEQEGAAQSSAGDDF